MDNHVGQFVFLWEKLVLRRYGCFIFQIICIVNWKWIEFHQIASKSSGLILLLLFCGSLVAWFWLIWLWSEFRVLKTQLELSLYEDTWKFLVPVIPRNMHLKRILRPEILLTKLASMGVTLNMGSLDVFLDVWLQPVSFSTSLAHPRSIDPFHNWIDLLVQFSVPISKWHARSGLPFSLY